MPELSKAKILIIATDGFEQSELVVPKERLSASGATVHVATPDGEPIRGWQDGNWGDTVEAELKIADARAEDYDALVLPGGQINPDVLRTRKEAVALVRDFADEGRIVAAICHGPWLLIEAGVVKGREATSYHSIRTDMENAGARWVDREVAVSEGIVTSRSPADLDAFIAKIGEEVREGRHQRTGA